MLAKTPARNIANFLLAALAADAILSAILASAQPQPQLLPTIVYWFYIVLLPVLSLWLLALPVLLTTDPTHPRALRRHALNAAIPPLLLLAFVLWRQILAVAMMYRLPPVPAQNFRIFEAGATLSVLTTALYFFFPRRNKHLRS